MSASNLAEMFAKADRIDRSEGMRAYLRYHTLMQRLADVYGRPLECVVAAFVSLSPNSDYEGNLRSTVTVLKAIKEGRGIDQIKTSSYHHCAVRAFALASGATKFSDVRRGPKITNFYHNLIDPTDPQWVTIDGHMVAAFRGKPLRMKDAKINRTEYKVIKNAVIELAAEHRILPNQCQAIMWFTRKRVYKVRFEPQINLFAAADGDVWGTLKKLEDVMPFEFKRAAVSA